MKTVFHSVFIVAMLLTLPACGKKPGASKPADIDYYTCTMHSSVRADGPGKCPICGMELVPVMKRGGGEAPSTDGSTKIEAKQEIAGMPGMPGMSPAKAGGSGAELNEFSVPVERQQQIGVTYAPVKRQSLQHTIRAVGMVEPDSTRRWSFVARVAGYIEKLLVTSPGKSSKKTPHSCPSTAQTCSRRSENSSRSSRCVIRRNRRKRARQRNA